jgi:hypothetical protein
MLNRIGIGCKKQIKPSIKALLFFSISPEKGATLRGVLTRLVASMSLVPMTCNPIALDGLDVDSPSILSAIESTNRVLADLSKGGGSVSLELYKIIDLRMLSGLVGELFVSELSKTIPQLQKNPWIDGYPDLLNTASDQGLIEFQKASIDSYLNFPFGGIEVKNTFGVKKTGINFQDRETRFVKATTGRSWKIQKNLVWKAHHQETNNLIALHSDYINKIPQIIGCFYSDELEPEDWSIKQQPKEGSTMTSFSATKPSAFAKLKKRVIALDSRFDYEEFL